MIDIKWLSESKINDSIVEKYIDCRPNLRYIEKTGLPFQVVYVYGSDQTYHNKDYTIWKLIAVLIMLKV